MTYNNQNLPRYVETAGKITVLTALSGVVIFALVFILNVGKTELQKVEAQGLATTTLTVLNTPPTWTAGQEGREQFESSTSTPTNSGSTTVWVGTATDANNAPYFLLICSGSASPTANSLAAPTCVGGTQWAVSTSTFSGQQARAATTTTEVAPFGEQNSWYAWICDLDVSSRCNNISFQGINATNSSPFAVNKRPVFTGFTNSGPTPPGGTITFFSTSSDADVADDDRIYLVVCGSASYSTTTNTCGVGDTVASSSLSFALNNATTSRILPSIIQDAANYAAFPYVYDQHGHSATGSAQGVNVNYTVSNVAPTVAGGTISLNLGAPMVLTNPGGQTSGFRLDFTVADANSCDAIGGGAADEVTSYVATVFMSSVSTTTCDGSALSYNPNTCYPSGVGSTTWNLSCTASTTSCTGATDDTINYTCTFPLWFIANPTDGTPFAASSTPFSGTNWSAGVAGVDNNFATGSMSTSTTAVEVNSLVAINMNTNLITYPPLESGFSMPFLTSTSSLSNFGNTGLNQILFGDSMCGTYSPTNPCPVSASSTIPINQQRFGATSTLIYASGTAMTASTSPVTFNIQIPKSTATSTPTSGTTYWGVAVPGSITLSGAYTGRNTFLGAVSASTTW
jgi:hypothetical protein